MTESLFWIGIVSSVSYLGLLLVKFSLSIWYVTRHPETCETTIPVTILQPILGGDAYLETALRTNLQSAPDCAHFLWLIDDDDDQGTDVANMLKENFPGRVDILVCPPCPMNLNPKIWKLCHALPNVQTEFLAVLDDDTMLGEQQLEKALAAMSTCELYTGLPHYDSGTSFWSSLVAHFVNNNSILTYLSTLPFLNPLSINGMFYVIRLKTINNCGGLESIQHELCDDFALAKLIKRHSGRIRQGITTQRLRTSIASAGHYTSVMHRWFVFANVLVREQSLATRLLLLILLGIPPLLFLGSFALIAGGLTGVTILLLFFFIRHSLLVLLHRWILGIQLRFHPLLSILSECLQVIHFLHAQLSSVIRWRRHFIRVKRDGTFVNLMEEKR